MTRRLTMLGTAALAGLMLTGQAVGGWLARPAAQAVAAVAPVPPGPNAAPAPTPGRDGVPAPAAPQATAAQKPAARPAATQRPARRPSPPTQPAKPRTGPQAAGVVQTTRGNGVSLTYDDGPSPAHTPRILALLRTHQVRATFCVVGAQAQAHPELVRQIVREGHQLCNHSWNHELDLGRSSPAQIRANLRRTNEAIRRASPGTPVEFFRHPGGNWTPAAIRVSRELGMTPVGWTVDPRDWERPPAGSIVDTVVKGSRRGAVVLLHDGGGDRRQTVTASGKIIPALKKRLRVVPLS
ncbi:MAG TPA: polysaccharide deacetylase family protein [Pilimelia sp.]|nr:polysaccharide deacetylase family protein [Pilimelia sp.]